jgi:hypothetical protein
MKLSRRSFINGLLGLPIVATALIKELSDPRPFTPFKIYADKQDIEIESGEHSTYLLRIGKNVTIEPKYKKWTIKETI